MYIQDYVTPTKNVRVREFDLASAKADIADDTGRIAIRIWNSGSAPITVFLGDAEFAAFIIPKGATDKVLESPSFIGRIRLEGTSTCTVTEFLKHG